MQRFIKLIIRICITILTLIIILSITDLIFKFKHEKSKNVEWENENVVILNMLKNKYKSKSSGLFPLVMMKDKDIKPKEKDEKRILVVGDSFILGYGGTNVNNTWWRQLDLIIKEKGYSNVNIYGAGNYFFNTKNELENILMNENIINKIDPDLIIIGFVMNDPEERDENNRNIIKDSYEYPTDKNLFYKYFKNTAIV